MEINFLEKKISFDELKKSLSFEKVCQGREAAIIVNPNKDGHIPILRTTTSYKDPAQIFNNNIYK